MHKAIGINLTYRCNLNCSYCYIGDYLNKNEVYKSRIDISLEDIKRRVEDFEIDTIFLTGGEPLLYPNLEELLDYLYTKNIQVNIATNGLLINEKIINIFEKYNVTLLLSIRENFYEKYVFINSLLEHNIKIKVYHLPTINSPFFLYSFFTRFPQLSELKLLYDSMEVPESRIWFSRIKKIYDALKNLKIKTFVEIGYLPKGHRISLDERKGAIDRIYMDVNGLLYNCPLMVHTIKGHEKTPEKCNASICPVLSKSSKRNDIFQCVCTFILTDISVINIFCKDKSI